MSSRMETSSSSCTTNLFVTCGQGLEPLLQEELAQLRFSDTTRGYRGVFVPDTSMEAIYRINYCSRIATRVLLPLADFKCFHPKALYQNALTIPWMQYIKKGSTFAIDANVTHPQIRNSLFAAQLVKDGICDYFREKTGSRPSVDVKEPDVQLNLFVHNNRAVLSLDTSGTPLHKRGYRIEGGLAPLHETLAASLLTLCGYDGTQTFFDPCCGSGTLLIEAALIATKTPPGYLRRSWGFMHLPKYHSEEWLKVKNSADDQRIPLKSGKISGTDINRDAVRISKTNARAAGFLAGIEIVQTPFQDFTPKTAPQLLLTNPPHGIRIGEEEALKPLYRDLGDFMKQKMEKSSVGAVFTANQELAKQIGLASKRKIPISSGGADCRLLLFDIF